MDADALDALLSAAVGPGGIPGAIGIVGDRDGVVYARPFGTIDVRTGAPLPLDAMLRIASLGKAVAAIAAMQLVEAGMLDLDTPVAEIFPEYDELMVVEGFDGDRPLLRRPRHRGTVRNLMTHTSGLTYAPFDANLLRYGEVTGVPMPVSGELRSFESPFVCEPGSRFAYGMSTDWTGRVIERLSGLPLEDCFRQRVLEPLGIRDMTFSPDAEQWTRVAPVHHVADDGSASVIDFEFPQEREFDPAGHGLYATAGAFERIQRVLLRGGELDGVRLLREETVQDMFANHIGELPLERMVSLLPQFSRDIVPPPGMKWGLDLMVTAEGRPGYRPTGSAGWIGTFNNYYWIDPVNGVTGALHASYLPLCEHRATDLFDAFERAVYDAL
jgi:methyl acetate hydrolase